MVQTLLSAIRSVPVSRCAIALCLLGLVGCTTPRPDSARLALDGSRSSVYNDDPIGRLLADQLLASHRAGITLDPRDAMAGEALGQLGIRYRYGGNSPDNGFDCSGLVSYAALQALGLKLPRSSAEIAAASHVIERADLMVGDLVFFNTMGRKYSHVGIYLGDNRFVHSPSAGGVVRIENMTLSYWNRRYDGARRLPGAALTAAR